MSWRLSRKLKIGIALVIIETLLLYPAFSNPLFGLTLTYYSKRLQEIDFKPEIELSGTPIIKNTVTIFNLTKPETLNSLFLVSEEEYNATKVSDGTIIQGRGHLKLYARAYLPLGAIDPLTLDVLAITLAPNIFMKLEIEIYSQKLGEDVSIYLSWFDFPQNNSVLNYTTKIYYDYYYKSSQLNGSNVALDIIIELFSSTGGEIEIKFKKFVLSISSENGFIVATLLCKDAHNTTLTDIFREMQDNKICYYLWFQAEISALFNASGKTIVQKLYISACDEIYFVKNTMYLNISILAKLAFVTSFVISRSLLFDPNKTLFGVITAYLPIYRLYFNVHTYDKKALNGFQIYIDSLEESFIFNAKLESLLELEYIPLPPGIYIFRLYPYFYEIYPNEMASKIRSPRLYGIIKVKNWDAELHLYIPAATLLEIPMSLPIYIFLVSYIGLWVIILAFIGARMIRKIKAEETL